MQADIQIAIVGGTGVYKLDGMSNTKFLDIDTPFGKPSCPIMVGTIHGVKVACVARHGLHHTIAPSEVPYAANIYALKTLGVKYMLAIGAVGSLRSEIAPLHMVVVQQFIDRTRAARRDTFFGNGIIAHVSLGHPVCANLSAILKESVESLALPEVVVHSENTTYVCMEGLAFSTKAESLAHQQMGGSVIGMTACPEYKLAREAEIAYALLAMVTDYDCWHPDHDAVTVDMVFKTLSQNGNNAQLILGEFIRRLAAQLPVNSDAHDSLKYAIVNGPYVTEELKEKLSPIIGKYLPSTAKIASGASSQQ